MWGRSDFDRCWNGWTVKRRERRARIATFMSLQRTLWRAQRFRPLLERLNGESDMNVAILRSFLCFDSKPYFGYSSS